MSPTRKSTGWFFDSVTLSNFALTGHMELLGARYGSRAFVSTQVADELATGFSSGHTRLSGCLELIDRDVIKTVAMDRHEREVFLGLIVRLGAGEAATIAIASCRNGIVVTDDLAARHACNDLKIRYTGTIGILYAMIRDGTLSLHEANIILTEMIQAGFHSPISRMTESP